MKIAIYKDSCAEGLVPRKIDPISANGNIVLLLNSEDGFSIAEVIDVIQKHFVCSLCGSSIGVEAEYGSKAIPKMMLADVIDEAAPVYILERTEGYIYYKWRCLGDNGRECSATYGWRKEKPPVLMIGGDACAGNTRSP